MSDPQTATPDADAIASAVFEHLVNDPNGGLSAKIRSQVEEILGPLPETPDGQSDHKGHIEAMVKSTVADLNLESELADMKEALATKPPPSNGSMRGPDAQHPLGFFDVNAPSAAAVGARINGQYADFADYIRQVGSLNAQVSRTPSERLTYIKDLNEVKATLTGEEISGGGALVPEEFRAQLMMASLGPTSIRSRATVIPMMSHTLSVPYIRDESHTDGSVYGGVEAFWTESGAELPDSDPDFGQVRLTAKLHTLYTEINNTLLADSAISLPMLLGMLWPNALRWSEERAFIRGSGAGEPLGAKDAGAALDVGGGDFDLEGAADMLSHLYPESMSSAVWMIHPSQWGNLIRMNEGSVSAFIHDLARPIPNTLLGLPVIWNEHMTAGSSDSVMLADWRFYLIGDRQAMSMSASEHYRFRSERTAFKSVSRLDGQPWTDTSTDVGGGTAHQIAAFVSN